MCAWCGVGVPCSGQRAAVVAVVLVHTSCLSLASVSLLPSNGPPPPRPRPCSKYPDLVVVDYTLPSAVNENAAFYCANALPFVMGTTGGDRDRLLADVAAAGSYAVIAPNMGKQIVAFQVGGGGGGRGGQVWGGWRVRRMKSSRVKFLNPSAVDAGALLPLSLPPPTLPPLYDPAFVLLSAFALAAFLQTMMEMMAQRFPGCFAGYRLAVAESHQRTKVDTSGTAKAVVHSLNKMGLDFSEVRGAAVGAVGIMCGGGSAGGMAVACMHTFECDAASASPPTSTSPPCPPACLPLQDQIEKVRRPEEQMGRMGVPESHVDSGHAFHTYTLTSPDGSGERMRAREPAGATQRGPAAACCALGDPVLSPRVPCRSLLARGE